MRHTGYIGVVPQQNLPPIEVAMRFRSGRACLDFVHTGTDEHMHELVNDDHDLAAFLRVVCDVPEVIVGEGDLERARTLRDAILRCALRVVEGAGLPRSAVTTINAYAASMPIVPTLGVAGDVRLHEATVEQALSTLARDAIALFAELVTKSAGENRLRRCAADDCGLFLLDTSRPNNRRWCSMELCGNRNKTRAYRARFEA